MPMNPRLLRPRATGFDPRSISGLALWLDARDGSRVLNSVSPNVAATNGQTVRRWSDKSGTGGDANQTDGNLQPTYSAGTAVEFDGSNDSMNISTSIARNKSYIATFVAFRPDVVLSSTRWLIAAATGVGNVRYGLNINSSGNFVLSCRRVDGGTFASVDPGAAGAVAVGARVVGTAQANYGAQVASVRLNGTQVGISSSFLDGGSTSDTNSQSATVGSFNASQYFDGSMFEMLVYTGAALSTSQVRAIERYLGRRHGVTVA